MCENAGKSAPNTCVVLVFNLCLLIFVDILCRLCLKFLCSYFYAYAFFLPLSLARSLSLFLLFYFCSFVIVSCCTQFTFVKFTCSKNVGIRVLYNDRIILMQTTYVVWHECIHAEWRYGGVRFDTFFLFLLSF